MGELLAVAVDSFSDLVQVHLALAKAELVRDARRTGANAAALAVGVPLVATGYLLLCISAGSGLGYYLGTVSGFGIVGGGNVFAGAVAIWIGVKRLRQPHHVDLTVGAELVHTVREVVPGLDNALTRVERARHAP